MNFGHDHHQRADAAVWITIGVIAMAVMGFALFGPFELDVRSFLIPGAEAPAQPAMATLSRDFESA